MKTALVFGGQGSQFTGMGKEVYAHSQKARNVFEIGTSIVGYDVAEMCFEAPQEKLNKTVYCQVCTLAVELALFEIFKEEEIRLDAVAGFSLGEYAALVAANVINIRTAFSLVNARAQAMEDSVKDGIGKMAAVINLDMEQVNSICDNIGNKNATIANYNSYKQFVVSLTENVFDSFAEKIKSSGGHIISLKVNRPFHHFMMRPAADKYYNSLQTYEFAMPDYPLYINVTGEKFNKNDLFHDKLYEQIFMPVQWIKIIENMLLEGISTFYEISPRATLISFINNISKNRAKVVDIKRELLHMNS